MSSNPLTASIARAVRNIQDFGDTDVFPFPLEHYVFRDAPHEVEITLSIIHEQFDGLLVRHTPQHDSGLAQVGYTSYRWATQLDPFWNAYYLALVLLIAPDIESRRIPRSEGIVYSYRYSQEHTSARIFDDTITWGDFKKRSEGLAKEHGWVVKCDVADFYARISHLRLQNSLRECTPDSETARRILRFLSSVSGEHTYGLPVGGPASRLLSELSLTRIDNLLRDSGVVFTRYSDDYHVFANTQPEAHRHLITLTEALHAEEGLSLQKLKTRVMRANEFLGLSEAHATHQGTVVDEPARAFLSVPLRFDPYSPTAPEDYERLRNEVARFDIMGLLGREIQKTRVHEALTRQLVKAIRFLEEPAKGDTVRTLVDNIQVLSPALSTVLLTIKDIFDELGPDTQQYVAEKLTGMLQEDAPVMRLVVHASYAARILARSHSLDRQQLLVRLFKETRSSLLRRDIILIMAQWKAVHWLSSLKKTFAHLGQWERRALIVASFALGPEGATWRAETSGSYDLAEVAIYAWAEGRAKTGKSGSII